MNDRMTVSTRKGLFRLQRDSGGTWQIGGPSFLGVAVSLSLHDPRGGGAGTHYAALDHGHFGTKLQRSNDGGSTWEEVAVPKYPALPEGQGEEKDPAGRPWPWTLKKIWALAIDPRQDGALWCGTIPGALFHSSDRGDNWRVVEPLWHMPERREWFGGGADYPGIHSICVHPDDAARVAVGVSCGGVWATEDGGETWRCRADGMRAEYMPPESSGNPNVQDPHCVVQCKGAPDTFWAQHHNGIFRSTDGLVSWREITRDDGGTTFGFPVVVHPRDPDTAWFVPAVKDECRVPADGRVVVTRTRDGGKTFDVLTEGLPRAHAYDLVYRHCFDIDAAGERLVFGSTTGSLWISDDSGESWQTIAAHLPPIYAVRFDDA